jgi:hypothetical protein
LAFCLSTVALKVLILVMSFAAFVCVQSKL